MSAVFDSLRRLTALGLVCGGLMAVGGIGGQKEILRLGCACLTVVVLFTTLQRMPVPTFDMSRYEEQARQRVEVAQEEAIYAILRQTEADMEQYLEGLAADMDLSCRFSVTCFVDAKSRVTVQRAEVVYQSGSRERLNELRDTICAQLAITDQQLTVREATP